VKEPRRLVVLDVDSTLTRDEGIDLLASFVSEEIAAQVASITAAAMRGELDFQESLKARVATLKGVSVEDVAAATSLVRLTDGAHEMVTQLQSDGHLVGAVSGGFHSMVDPLATELGLNFHRANTLEVFEGYLTGRTIGDLIDARAKSDTLQSWAEEHSIDMAHTVAVGDGGNDVMMLSDAGLGIAFMAKQVAREAADVVIDVPDLRLVLEEIYRRT
jgi:phosphoserine phosphatase